MTIRLNGQTSGYVELTAPAVAANNTMTLPSSGDFAATTQLGLRNLIINGAMQVAQRGTSSTSTSYGTVDRFRSEFSSGTVTQSQQSLTSGDPYDQGLRYFLRAANTTAGSDDATEQREIRHYIEAQNFASSGWNYASSTSYLTLSFWARSSVGGTYYVLNRSVDGTGQGYTFSYTLTADTWKKVTHTIPGNSSITVDNDNGIGFQVRFLIDLGTNFTDSGHTLNAWAAFDDTSRCPDFGQDWAGTTNATFDVTGVQLEVGSVATPFEHRSFSDELAKCQRYYYKIFENTNPTYYGIGSTSGTNQAYFVVPFPVTMRTAPSALETHGTASHFALNLSGANRAATGISFVAASTHAATVNLSSSSNFVGTNIAGRALSTNNAAYLAWSAEL